MATPTTPAQAQKLYPDPQSFANFLNQHWPGQVITSPKSVGGVVLTGSSVGQQWLNWYATVSPNHPSYSLGNFEITFFDFAVAASLAHGIAKAEVATGQFTGQAAQATVSGLTAANPLAGLAAIGQFFSNLSQASTWLRVGEGILGIILIAVGVARMTHAVPVATKIAKAIK